MPNEKAQIGSMRLGILFFTVFVDLIGFGIVLPLLPIYADGMGATGLQIGFIVVSYSIAQLLFAPIWGRLSDRFGRRWILIVGLLGSSVSYLVFAYAGTIAILLLSRILAGVGGANISVAQAYVADITEPHERAGKLGILGSAFALGFVFGPAIGGVLAPIALPLPGIVASGLCAVNALLAIIFLPESLPRKGAARGGAAGLNADAAAMARSGGAETGVAGPDAAGSGAGAVSAGGSPGGSPAECAVEPVRAIVPPRLKLAQVFSIPGMRLLLSLTFLFTAAFAVMHPTFALLASERFGFGESTVGWLFALLGLVSAISQGVLVPALSRRIGEAAIVRSSALPLALGLALAGTTRSFPLLLAGMVLMAYGMGASMPALTGLLSRMAPGERQGGSLGLGQSVSALARIIGPILGGGLWDYAGPSWPYLVGAGLALIGGIGSLALRQPAAIPPSAGDAALSVFEG